MATQVQGKLPITKLSDLAKIDEKEYITYKPENYVGRGLNFVSFEWKNSNYNTPFCVMYCQDLLTKQRVVITSGHKPIVDLLSQLEEGKEYNLPITFKATGRTHMIDDWSG